MIISLKKSITLKIYKINKHLQFKINKTSGINCNINIFSHKNNINNHYKIISRDLWKNNVKNSNINILYNKCKNI